MANVEKRIIKALVAAVALCLAAVVAVGCSSSGSSAASSTSASGSSQASSSAATQEGAPQIDGLTFDHELELQYANQFAVYYYNDGFKVLRVVGDVDYLIVPENATAPASLPAGMVVLQQPLDNIYLCATASASLFDAIGGLDNVKFTGTDASGWSIESMRNAVESGDIKFAGKYSSPDYETLVSAGCDMALESTMILHAPEIKEAIEQLGIPVFIEHSSFESEPMGRVEWAKAFGALLNLDDEAAAFFDEQVKIVGEMEQFENTGKTVAFFSVNSTGQVVVRRPGDYISKSIELAGGKYAFPNLDDSGTLSTLKMSMEEFYATAVSVDYLVYNGTIEEALTSIDDLVAKDATFADYKAVKEGHVYTVDKDMYQATDKIAGMIHDFHILVTGGDDSEMVFLTKVS